MKPSLFIQKRICCVCESEAPSNLRELLPGEPNIIALSMTIYRRGKGKGELKAVKRVQVCESCLARALTGGRLIWAGGDRGGWKLWAAIRSNLLIRYSTLIEDEKA
jgi:hypothetical protein